MGGGITTANIGVNIMASTSTAVMVNAADETRLT